MADKAEIDAKLERLNEVREKIEEVKQSRSKLTGELETHRKRLEELKKTCNDNYQIDPEDLADNIKVLEDEIEADLSKAENLLGITQAE